MYNREDDVYLNWTHVTDALLPEDGESREEKAALQLEKMVGEMQDFVRPAGKAIKSYIEIVHISTCITGLIDDRFRLSAEVVLRVYWQTR